MFRVKPVTFLRNPALSRNCEIQTVSSTSDEARPPVWLSIGKVPRGKGATRDGWSLFYSLPKGVNE